AHRECLLLFAVEAQGEPRELLEERRRPGSSPDWLVYRAQWRRRFLMRAASRSSRCRRLSQEKVRRNVVVLQPRSLFEDLRDHEYRYDAPSRKQSGGRRFAQPQ